MLDNGGNTDRIDNGQARVLRDSDGLSEKISSLKSAHILTRLLNDDSK